MTKDKDTSEGSNTEQVQNYLELAREFQEQNLYQKAEDTLLMGLKKLPNHPFLLTRLANFYFKTERSEKALKTLKRLIKKNSNFSFSFYLRAKIYEDQKDYRRAISDYKKALTRSNKDLHVLTRLIPLLVENDHADEAINLILEYQNLFNDPFLFSQQEAEALVKLKQNVNAFNKMRSLLMQEPDNHQLLRKYLRLSIKTSKKSPIELYEMLRETVPQLRVIKGEELTDLEVDYLIHNKRYQEAEQKIFHMIEEFPDRYHWRKKNVLLQKTTDKLERIADELEILFLYNTRDSTIRSVFDEYFIQGDRLQRWKKVIQKAKRTRNYGEEFPRHLRNISIKNNLLSHSSMDFHSYVDSVRSLEFEDLRFDNITYKKLPLFVLESFISEISIFDRIPKTGQLWEMVSSERASDHKEIPFQMEDLSSAYPVWLFVLQFYFLFRSSYAYSCFFRPWLFLQNQIALVIEVDGQTIQLDVGQVLENSRKLKEFARIRKEWHWRWPKDMPPDQVIKGIPIYSKSQLRDRFGELLKMVVNKD